MGIQNNYKLTNKQTKIQKRKMIGKTIATVSLAAASVNAHGYLKTPAARNWARSIPEHMTYEPQSLPAGGPGSVFENGGYAHGMCGDSKANPDQKWNMPGQVQASYTEGETIDMSVVITAHHSGWFEAQLCDKQDISEECFYANRLMRPGCTDVNDEECFRVWKPLLSLEVPHSSMDGFSGTMDVVDRSTSNIFTTELHYQMVLPQDVTCSHCVMRWHWFTTNSCAAKSDGQSGTSEEFWNCADVRVSDVLNQAPQTEATAAQITALRADVPRNMYTPDLRSDNMWRFCPTQSYPTDAARYMDTTCPECSMLSVTVAEDGSNDIPDSDNSNNNNASPASTYRCGADWSDATNSCHSTCVTSEDCLAGQTCFSGVADICGTEQPETTTSTTSTFAPTTTTTSAAAPTTTTTSAAAETTEESAPCVVTVTSTNMVTGTVTSTVTVTATNESAPTQDISSNKCPAGCQGCWDGAFCWTEWDAETCSHYPTTHTFCM